MQTRDLLCSCGSSHTSPLQCHLINISVLRTCTYSNSIAFNFLIFSPSLFLACLRIAAAAVRLVVELREARDGLLAASAAETLGVVLCVAHFQEGRVREDEVPAGRAARRVDHMRVLLAEDLIPPVRGEPEELFSIACTGNKQEAYDKAKKKKHNNTAHTW
jgi:hypothetical protein